QWNGFSPVCIRIWASISRFVKYIWILPLRCTLPCRLRPFESGNLFPQSVQEKGRRPAWRLTWLSRAARLLRTRPHSPHWFLSSRLPMTDKGCNGDTTGGALTGMGRRETLGGNTNV
uniref:Uncharacterized protein n=1 Tax=Cyclopterus lumpus TaxID=8103 RepID=A0A8C2WBQ3_CYCLU